MADPLRQTYGEVFFLTSGLQRDPYGLANFHPASNVNRLDIYLEDGVSTNVVMVNFKADGKGYPTSVFFPTLYGGTVQKVITGEASARSFAKYSLLVPPQVLQWNENGTSTLSLQTTVVQTAGDGLLGAFENYTALTTAHPATEDLMDDSSIAYVYTTVGSDEYGFYAVTYNSEAETYSWTLVDNPVTQINMVDTKQYNIVGMQIQKGNLPRPTSTVTISDEYIRYILAYISTVNAIALTNKALIGDKVTQDAYIVGATPLASDWLSLTDGGSALTPVYGTFYVILDGVSAGDDAYVGLEYIWNGTAYVQYTSTYGTLLYRMGIAEYDIDAIIDGSQNITYDPTISGLVATTLKGAVDEVVGLIANMKDGTDAFTQISIDDGSGNIAYITYTHTNGNHYQVLDITYPDGRVVQLNEQIEVNYRNTTGATVNSGAVLMANGVTTGNQAVNAVLFDETSCAGCELIGVATVDGINVNSKSKATRLGIVSSIAEANLYNTGTAYVEGQIVYARAGKLSNVAPSKPNMQVRMGIIINKVSTNYDVLIFPQVLPLIDSLSNVTITNGAENDVIIRNASGVWVNSQRLKEAEDDIDALELYVNSEEARFQAIKLDIDELEDGTTVIPTYELKANKATDFSTVDDTKYPTVEAVKEQLDTKVPLTRTIIGLDLQDNILISEFKTALGNATQVVSGLMSESDKAHLDNLVALLETSDGNNVVDTIGEILAIFNNYPEGADLVTALNGKVDKVSGKALSTNDLTDVLKSYYDSAYTHSQIADGTNPHNTTFANLANKPTTVDGYGITDVYKKTQTYTQAEIDALLNDLQTTKGLQNTLLTPTELTNGQTIETSQLTTNKTLLMFVATNQDSGEIDSDIVQVSSILTGTKFVFFDNESITFTIGETNSTFVENGNYTLKINALEIASDFSAEQLSYDNTASEREATNVQEALDEAFGEIDAHVGSTSNPHGVTTSQIGAEPAFSKNTAFNKNFGTTAGTVSEGNHLHTNVYEPANANIQSHITNTSNPHSVTKTQVGLSNVDNVQQIPLSQKGSVNGVAELDSTGKVPSSQLPSFVDDVLEFANLASLPTTGESGKIYITQDTNKTYRWSGSGYVEISASLALGETSSTAYRGDRGKIAYDHTSLTNNPHSVTATQVGLGNVLNYGIANQTDAETGTANDKYMTPLRTAQAIAELSPDPNLTPYDNHIADSTIHFTQSQISITESQISDFGNYEPANSNIQQHISSTSNPHSVTKTQVGLGNVDNTADANKYVKGLIETRANTNTQIWTGTQAQYDAIGTPDANTLYFITD